MARSSVSMGRQLAGVAACVLSCTLPTESVEHQALANETAGGTVDTALVALADTYVLSEFPNVNRGADTSLWLSDPGKRPLVRFDQAQMAAAVGTGTLAAARLELTITDALPGGWGAGRPVDVHRLTQAWTELGATWHCADDLDPGNTVPDCPEAAWEMGAAGPNPFIATPTDSVTITNGLSGVVELDVTADVAAFLAGSAENHGWLVKARDESLTGHVIFRSRENASPPRLVLTVQQADTSRPPVPEEMNLPIESALTVPATDDSVTVYFRDVVGVIFDDSTSGATVGNVLEAYGGSIIGGNPPRTYIVQIPDPGTSIQALDSVRTAIASEAGVSYVLRITLHASFDPRARYPSDGTGAEREDWFSTAPGAGTRSRLAIRALLSWGCETGLYGSTRVRVGVIDLAFPAQHPDLPSFQVAEPTTNLVPLGLLGDPVLRSHGISVAGVMSAIGDNGRGIAGVMWDTDLRFLAFGQGTSVQASPVLRWERLLQEASSNDVRVILTSTGFEVSSDTAVVRHIREALESYLSDSPDRLFVFALPDKNGGLATSISDVAGNSSSQVTALDRAVAQLFPSLRGQILLVAGLDAQGVRWSESDFWTGDTLIAAPAVDILTLARVDDFPDTTRVATGTSYAAPFVAGVAAQLLAMDSSLTAGDVKSYILRGAQEPRLNPNTGEMDPPDPVQGAPETVYQLDAYGALTLLSKERAGTPICGVEVSYEGQTVTIHRNQPETKMIPGAGADPAVNPLLSVAQGGRLIAVNNPDGSGVLQFNHRVDPSSVMTLPGLLGRMFLERDTLDLAIPDTALQATLRRVNGQVVGPVDLAPRTAPSAADARVHQVIAAPFGDWAAVQTLWLDGTGFTYHQWDLVNLLTADAPVLVNNSAVTIPGAFCGTACEISFLASAAWSADSRRVVVTLPNGDATEVDPTLFAIRTRASNITFDNQRNPTVPALAEVASNRGLVFPRFTPDGMAVIVNQADHTFDTCEIATRQAASLATVIVGPSTAPVDHCDTLLPPTPPIPFNLRAASVPTGPWSDALWKTKAEARLPPSHKNAKAN